MPFGLSPGEIALALVMLSVAIAFVAWIGWIVIETVRRFASELRGATSDRHDG